MFNEITERASDRGDAGETLQLNRFAGSTALAVATSFLWLLTLTNLARGSSVPPSISLPLNGYFRPGKYFPVRIDAGESAPEAKIVLEAEGAVPSECISSSQSHVIVPLLPVFATAGELRWRSDGKPAAALPLPLHPLADDQRLIGFAGADADALKEVFAGRTLLGVALDFAKPFAGPIVAWETLDGVVLDANAAARVTQAQLRGLIDAGTAVAIRSSQRPAGAWPWVRAGDYWILRVQLSGPNSSYLPSAYAPTAAWARGAPQTLRKQVLLIGIMIGLLALGATLWPSKASLPLVIIICAATVAGTLMWRSRLPASIEIGGDIFITSSDHAQCDAWTYRSALRPGPQSVAFSGLTKPVLGYRMQVSQTGLRLICAGDGEPRRFEFQMRPEWSIAFIRRSAAPGELSAAVKRPVNSPLRPLAEEIYLKAGDSIVGQTQGSGSTWDGLVIKNTVSPDRAPP